MRFWGLPERDSHGTRYTYWVEETVPDGYEVTYDGNDIINSLTPDPEPEPEPEPDPDPVECTGSRCSCTASDEGAYPIIDL